MVKVEQLVNDNGNPSNNQVVLTEGYKVTFVSYGTPIAKINKKNQSVTIGTSYRYSKTTMKHLLIFLRDYASTILPYRPQSICDVDKWIDRKVVKRTKRW